MAGGLFSIVRFIMFCKSDIWWRTVERFFLIVSSLMSSASFVFLSVSISELNCFCLVIWLSKSQI